MELQKGDRVQVLAHWNWPQPCTGRIAVPPDWTEEMLKEHTVPGDPEVRWLGCRRVVRGRKGPIEFYWVIFDEPQMDGDGDGPYLGGEVETEYLRRLEAR